MRPLGRIVGIAFKKEQKKEAKKEEEKKEENEFWKKVGYKGGDDK